MNTNAKKIIQISSLSIFFLLILIYGFVRSQDLIFGIRIKDVKIGDSPAVTPIKIEQGVVEVTGVAENAINLTLNGREITIDQKGKFKETIALLPGYNIISIVAKDKFGYVDEKDYKLIH